MTNGYRQGVLANTLFFCEPRPKQYDRGKDLLSKSCSIIPPNPDIGINEKIENTSCSKGKPVKCHWRPRERGSYDLQDLGGGETSLRVGETVTWNSDASPTPIPGSTPIPSSVTEGTITSIVEGNYGYEYIITRNGNRSQFKGSDLIHEDDIPGYCSAFSLESNPVPLYKDNEGRDALDANPEDEAINKRNIMMRTKPILNSIWDDSNKELKGEIEYSPKYEMKALSISDFRSSPCNTEERLLTDKEDDIKLCEKYARNIRREKALRANRLNAGSEAVLNDNQAREFSVGDLVRPNPILKHTPEYPSECGGKCNACLPIAGEPVAGQLSSKGVIIERGSGSKSGWLRVECKDLPLLSGRPTWTRQSVWYHKEDLRLASNVIHIQTTELPAGCLEYRTAEKFEPENSQVYFNSRHGNQYEANKLLSSIQDRWNKSGVCVPKINDDTGVQMNSGYSCSQHKSESDCLDTSFKQDRCSWSPPTIDGLCGISDNRRFNKNGTGRGDIGGEENKLCGQIDVLCYSNKNDNPLSLELDKCNEIPLYDESAQLKTKEELEENCVWSGFSCYSESDNSNSCSFINSSYPDTRVETVEDGIYMGDKRWYNGYCQNGYQVETNEEEDESCGVCICDNGWTGERCNIKDCLHGRWNPDNELCECLDMNATAGPPWNNYTCSYREEEWLASIPEGEKIPSSIDEFRRRRCWTGDLCEIQPTGGCIVSELDNISGSSGYKCGPKPRSWDSQDNLQPVQKSDIIDGGDICIPNCNRGIIEETTYYSCENGSWRLRDPMRGEELRVGYYGDRGPEDPLSSINPSCIPQTPCVRDPDRCGNGRCYDGDGSDINWPNEVRERYGYTGTPGTNIYSENFWKDNGYVCLCSGWDVVTQGTVEGRFEDDDSFRGGFGTLYGISRDFDYRPVPTLASERGTDGKRSHTCDVTLNSCLLNDELNKMVGHVWSGECSGLTSVPHGSVCSFDCISSDPICTGAPNYYFNGGKILNYLSPEDPEEKIEKLENLNTWINEAQPDPPQEGDSNSWMFQSGRWELAYSTPNGDLNSYQEFHSRCDKYDKAVIIIKTENSEGKKYIFGGYTGTINESTRDTSLEDETGDKIYKNSDQFLFRLEGWPNHQKFTPRAVVRYTSPEDIAREEALEAEGGSIRPLAGPETEDTIYKKFKNGWSEFNTPGGSKAEPILSLSITQQGSGRPVHQTSFDPGIGTGDLRITCSTNSAYNFNDGDNGLCFKGVTQLSFPDGSKGLENWIKPEIEVWGWVEDTESIDVCEIEFSKNVNKVSENCPTGCSFNPEVVSNPPEIKNGITKDDPLFKNFRSSNDLPKRKCIDGVMKSVDEIDQLSGKSGYAGLMDVARCWGGVQGRQCVGGTSSKFETAGSTYGECIVYEGGGSVNKTCEGQNFIPPDGSRWIGECSEIQEDNPTLLELKDMVNVFDSDPKYTHKLSCSDKDLLEHGTCFSDSGQAPPDEPDRQAKVRSPTCTGTQTQIDGINCTDYFETNNSTQDNCLDGCKYECISSNLPGSCDDPVSWLDETEENNQKLWDNFCEIKLYNSTDCNDAESVSVRLDSSSGLTELTESAYVNGDNPDTRSFQIFGDCQNIILVDDDPLTGDIDSNDNIVFDRHSWKDNVNINSHSSQTISEANGNQFATESGSGTGGFCYNITESNDNCDGDLACDIKTVKITLDTTRRDRILSWRERTRDKLTDIVKLNNHRYNNGRGFYPRGVPHGKVCEFECIDSSVVPTCTSTNVDCSSFYESSDKTSSSCPAGCTYTSGRSIPPEISGKNSGKLKCINGEMKSLENIPDEWIPSPNEMANTYSYCLVQRTSEIMSHDQDCVSEWNVWGPCSQACGGGQKTRTLKITTPASGNGTPCPTNLTETQGCNEEACPVDDPEWRDEHCEVRGWNEWSQCSVPCGGGVQSRSKTIITPSAGAGTPCPSDECPMRNCDGDGVDCSNCLSETRACNEQDCTPPGQTTIITDNIGEGIIIQPKCSMSESKCIDETGYQAKNIDNDCNTTGINAECDIAEDNCTGSTLIADGGNCQSIFGIDESNEILRNEIDYGLKVFRFGSNNIELDWPLDSSEDLTDNGTALRALTNARKARQQDFIAGHSKDKINYLPKVGEPLKILRNPLMGADCEYRQGKPMERNRGERIIRTIDFGWVKQEQDNGAIIDVDRPSDEEFERMVNCNDHNKTHPIYCRYPKYKKIMKVGLSRGFNNPQSSSWYGQGQCLATIGTTKFDYLNQSRNICNSQHIDNYIHPDKTPFDKIKGSRFPPTKCKFDIISGGGYDSTTQDVKPIKFKCSIGEERGDICRPNLDTCCDPKECNLPIDMDVSIPSGKIPGTNIRVDINENEKGTAIVPANHSNTQIYNLPVERNQKSENGVCVECEKGKVKDRVIWPRNDIDLNVECIDIDCNDNQKVDDDIKGCVTCPNGEYRSNSTKIIKSRERANIVDTREDSITNYECEAIQCLENEKVVNNECVSCQIVPLDLPKRKIDGDDNLYTNMNNTSCDTPTLLELAEEITRLYSKGLITTEKYNSVEQYIGNGVYRDGFNSNDYHKWLDETERNNQTLWDDFCEIQLYDLIDCNNNNVGSSIKLEGSSGLTEKMEAVNNNSLKSFKVLGDCQTIILVDDDPTAGTIRSDDNIVFGRHSWKDKVKINSHSSQTISEATGNSLTTYRSDGNNGEGFCYNITENNNNSCDGDLACDIKDVRITLDTTRRDEILSWREEARTKFNEILFNGEDSIRNRYDSSKNCNMGEWLSQDGSTCNTCDNTNNNCSENEILISCGIEEEGVLKRIQNQNCITCPVGTYKNTESNTCDDIDDPTDVSKHLVSIRNLKDSGIFNNENIVLDHAGEYNGISIHSLIDVTVDTSWINTNIIGGKLRDEKSDTFDIINKIIKLGNELLKGSCSSNEWYDPSVTSGDRCKACTVLDCNSNEYGVPCTLASDSSCLPCIINDPLQVSLVEDYECTNENDTVINSCIEGYYVNDNTCVPCTMEGKSDSTTLRCTNENDAVIINPMTGSCLLGYSLTNNSFTNNRCSPCTPVENMIEDGSIECINQSSSRITGCIDGFYKVEGGQDEHDTCIPCNQINYSTPDSTYTCINGDNSRINEGSCIPGYYKETGTYGDTCEPCSTVTNMSIDSTYYCTNPIDTRISSCEDGFYKVEGGQDEPDTCERCTTVNNGISVTCTSELDSRISSCGNGFYKVEGVQNDTCMPCTEVTNAESDATYVCTNELDSRISACEDGYYKVEGTENDTCEPCILINNARSDATYTCTSELDSDISSCEDGFYKTYGGVDQHDICTPCTEVTNAGSDATYTCTNELDSRISACENGFYKTEGSDNQHDICTPCTEVINAESGATYTCTNELDSRISSCGGGFYKTEGSDNQHDICTPCNEVTNAESDATYTCTSEYDSRVSGCVNGFYNNEGTCEACVPVNNASSDATYTCTNESDTRVSSCENGFYKTEGWTNQSDTCNPCTPVTNANSEVTCTSNSDSRVNGCIDGFYHDLGDLTDTCVRCTLVDNAKEDATYTCSNPNDSRINQNDCKRGYSYSQGAGSPAECTSSDESITCTLNRDKDGCIGGDECIFSPAILPGLKHTMDACYIGITGAELRSMNQVELETRIQSGELRDEEIIILQNRLNELTGTSSDIESDEEDEDDEV